MDGVGLIPRHANPELGLPTAGHTTRSCCGVPLHIFVPCSDSNTIKPLNDVLVDV